MIPILSQNSRFYDCTILMWNLTISMLANYLTNYANIISTIFIRQYGANENDYHFGFQHKYGKL